MLNFLKKIVRETKQKEEIKRMISCPYMELIGTYSSEQLMQIWQEACRETKHGFPVLVVWDEQLQEMIEINLEEETEKDDFWRGELEEERGYDEDGLPDVDLFLKPYMKKLLEDKEGHYFLGNEKDRGEAVNSFQSFRFMEKGERILLVTVPASRPWEVFKWIPMGGWNECPDAELMMAFSKRWYERYKAVPAVISGDTLEYVVGRKPEQTEEAFRLSKEMYGFCSDLVQESTTIWAAAKSLMKSGVWYFWWD